MSTNEGGAAAGHRASVGIALRRLREWALLTQEELAARTSLSACTTRRIESGVLERPRAETIRLLVDALGLTPEEHRGLLRPGPTDPNEPTREVGSVGSAGSPRPGTADARGGIVGAPTTAGGATRWTYRPG